MMHAMSEHAGVGVLPFDGMGLYEQPRPPRLVFKMPRVVPDQKTKFESDELFRRLSRESEVRYTGYRDRPQEERQVRFQNGCREGHTEIAFAATGTNLQLVFGNASGNYAVDPCDCDFDKEHGKYPPTDWHFSDNGANVSPSHPVPGNLRPNFSAGVRSRLSEKAQFTSVLRRKTEIRDRNREKCILYSIWKLGQCDDSHPARKNETYVELDPERETRDATRHADPSLVLSARISLTNVPGTSIHEAPGVVDRAQKGAGGDAH
ncbi:Protein big brother [Camponotus floridanus]|uniref:Protein big brother n=1 Tax=Camponotus floridanus TaxID=104421 RepID=E2A3R5_CAMFO|nr:Protein big brother [Camponotus floridanus]